MNVVQSAALSAPLLIADAVGISMVIDKISGSVGTLISTYQGGDPWWSVAISQSLIAGVPVVTEAGDVEKWDGNGKSQLLKYKEEALEYLKKQKKE